MVYRRLVDDTGFQIYIYIYLFIYLFIFIDLFICFYLFTYLFNLFIYITDLSLQIVD